MTTLAPPRSAVALYAESVVAGAVVTGRLVRLACERHLRDLDHGHERGLHFDQDAADFACEFFSYLSHYKGEWAGQPFILEPWQRFIIGSLFGWKRADGTRRFRVAYNELGRKNGKSILAAGVGLLLAFFDGEGGAEVYSAATKREQAKIVWGDARTMVLKSPDLKRRISVLVGNLHQESTSSKFQPLGADTDGMDGLNIHGAIVDELHAHKARIMWDVIQTATGARRQPLTFVITTAGAGRLGVCWEQHDYAVKVLEGVIEDDSAFAYIATLDEGDDWRDPLVWIKANPNLGISVKVDDLERKCLRAQQVPAEQNEFLRKHCDIWTTQSMRWLSDELWMQGAAESGALSGRSCYGCVYVSSVTDLGAFVLWFPDEAGGGDLLSWFWVPEENMAERVKSDRVPYDVWVREGWVEATDGNVVDYDLIRQRIKALGLVYKIKEIAVPVHTSVQVQTQLLGDGFAVVAVVQGFAALSAPTKEMQRLLLDGKYRHGGNPVLRWMAGNVAVRTNAEEEMRPDKEQSTERIDGIAAAINALSRALVKPEEKPSVYQTRGFLEL